MPGGLRCDTAKRLMMQTEQVLAQNHGEGQ
jgi:hypothetical protein